MVMVSVDGRASGATHSGPRPSDAPGNAAQMAVGSYAAASEVSW